MRSPTYLIISLVSTTLLSGSSASSATVATAGKPQVVSVLGRSREMIQKVNATLRKVQAGVPAADNAAFNAKVEEQTRIFTDLTAQILAATAPVAQVQVQAQIKTTTTSTVAPTGGNTITSPQNLASSQETPMSSVGAVANAKLASTTSPRLMTYEDEGDEDIALPNSIVGQKQGREGRIEEVEAESRKAPRKETVVIDVSSSSSTVRTTVAPTVATTVTKTNQLNLGIDANIIKERLAKRKLTAISSITSAPEKTSTVATSASNVNTTSYPSSTITSATATKIASTIASTTVSAKVSASPANNTAQIGTTSIPKVIPSPVQAAPLKVASVTPANSPADELAALMGDSNAFLERFFELDGLYPESLNRPTSHNGQTLFELAVRSGNMEITDLLLGAGYCSVTFANGENVLNEAVKMKNSELVRRIMTNPMFHGQVNFYVLGLARYDPTLIEFLKAFLKR